ncbi:hypothetical protein [Plantactinospora sp. GCM10030261]|uniref:AMIN-like domain-containing (lipo)protein n=1 Tax=Plantactinospora sp. GCM10030261 TaxID=3273420 RepID=UPI003607CA49
MAMWFPRRPVALLTCAAVAFVAGCGGGDQRSPDTGGASGGASVSAPTGPTASVPVSPPSTGGPSAADYRVTYDWAVPKEPVHVDHRLRVPIAPPPAEPLPVLVRIDVGDHPADDFTRMTFAFRGARPGYEVAYVPRVEADGSGERVSLPGNAFLRVRFDQAQAHDFAGAGTVVASPPATLGFPTLRGYAAAGDFEGSVTFGLGLQTAVGSDQVLPIRLIESRRPDGTYAVSVDVRRG